jgi:hypothetical protein
MFVTIAIKITPYMVGIFLFTIILENIFFIRKKGDELVQETEQEKEQKYICCKYHDQYLKGKVK